jgi:hypothetical protein
LTTEPHPILQAVTAIHNAMNLIDEDHYTTDIAYLNGLADYILEVQPHKPHQYPCGPTIYQQTVASLSQDAHRAIFSVWPA